VDRGLHWDLATEVTSMIRSLVGLSVLVSSLFLASGCNNASCESLCNEAEDRGCNTFVLGTGSCESDCALAKRISDRGGCDAQYEARVDCEAAQEDICDVGCGAEDNALLACAQSYCAANPSDADCQRLLGL
jgi:hypothetical protein